MLQIVLVLAVIGIAVYQWLTWYYDYWEKLGVRYIQPKLFFGNLKDSILGKDNVGVIYKKLYWVYPDEPAVGLFKGRKPQLMVKDVDLIKTMLIKEFNSFHDPDVNVDESSNPVLGLNPFVLKGERWKKVRSIHTQRQTTAKIKSMFSMIEEVERDMLKFIEEHQNVDIESRYFAGQFTTDVMGSCVFGHKTNSFLDPNAEFRKMTAEIFKPDTSSNIAFLLSAHAPWIVKLLKMKIIKDEVIDFFVKITKDMYEYRLKNNVTRNDYLGSLMENKSDNPGFSVQEISGFSLTFLLDGYETSSTVMGFILCCLSLHQEFQKTLRDEVTKAEKLDYDTVHTLPYLDAVINETLRMYPPGAVLMRECTQDIVLKNGGRDYPLRRGMTAVVPVYAIHTDPKYFPQPEVFNPERFYKQNPSPYFFPFGMGPRSCLGQRFALTQIKAAIASIIKNYMVLPVEGKDKMPEINPESPFLLFPKDPMWVRFSKI